MVDNTIMSASKALANTPPFTNVPITGFKRIELQVGDLVVWTGKERQYAMLQHGIIYRVIEKKEAENGDPAAATYRLGAAFEFCSPIGSSVDVTGLHGSRELKKLGLLDLGIIRLAFDNFIREWAGEQGAKLEQMPTAHDIVRNE